MEGFIIFYVLLCVSECVSVCAGGGMFGLLFITHFFIKNPQLYMDVFIRLDQKRFYTNVSRVKCLNLIIYISFELKTY